jgi:hypothetical protein
MRIFEHRLGAYERLLPYQASCLIARKEALDYVDSIGGQVSGEIRVFSRLSDERHGGLWRTAAEWSFADEELVPATHVTMLCSQGERHGGAQEASDGPPVRGRAVTTPQNDFGGHVVGRTYERGAVLHLHGPFRQQTLTHMRPRQQIDVN